MDSVKGAGLSRAAGGLPSATEIRLFDVRARQEAVPRALEHDAAVLEHVAAVRELERPRHVLLDEDDRRAAAIDPLERLEDQLHRQGRQPKTRLAQPKEPPGPHEPPSPAPPPRPAARQGPRRLPRR